MSCLPDPLPGMGLPQIYSTVKASAVTSKNIDDYTYAVTKH